MNNSPEQIERFDLFRTGWRRQSEIYLDAAGCPQWLIKNRCKIDEERLDKVVNYLHKLLDFYGAPKAEEIFLNGT